MCTARSNTWGINVDEWISKAEYKSDQRSVWKEIGRIGAILEGPPHPGMETRMNDFLVEFRTLETEREKQHHANKVRLDIIIAILTLVATYLGIFHH